jgi:Icc protein
MTSGKVMRLLHVTDLHILPEPGPLHGTDTLESLRAVSSAALALPEPPNVIVATGDLSEDGSERSYRRLRGLLLETGLPCYVVPGNHDDPEALPALLGGAIERGPVVDRGAWRFVLLDSTVRGKSYGLLDPAQLSLLDAALEEDPSRPVVVGLHHGPIEYCPSSDCRLHNVSALLSLLSAHENARAVLAGHGHVDVERQVGHLKLFASPSTGSQLRHLGGTAEDFWGAHEWDVPRHGFRMLSLGEDGSVTSRQPASLGALSLPPDRGERRHRQHRRVCNPPVPNSALDRTRIRASAHRIRTLSGPGDLFRSGECRSGIIGVGMSHLERYMPASEALALSQRKKETQVLDEGSSTGIRTIRHLHELRAMCGLSQQEVAERLGLQQSTISKLERRRDPSLNTLVNYVGAMGGEIFVEIRLPDAIVNYIGSEEDPPTSR